ncbi:MAG: hypothetical protein RBR86_08200 [Pseudobdellovibrionaceae bacterium]|jgi:hypothetical protein|nr:hypothetical protein [Pseudobdellovibrionaceae bacterium]
MFPKRYLLLLLGLSGFLSACQTAEGYRQQLEAYRGMSEQFLVQDWGVPNNSYELNNGGKVLQYRRDDTYVVPGATTFSPQTTYNTGNIYGNNGLYGSYSGTSTTYTQSQAPDVVIRNFCETSFMLDQKRVVVDYTFAGSGCVAPEETSSSFQTSKQAEAIRLCNQTLPTGTVGPKFQKCVAEITGE